MAQKQKAPARGLIIKLRGMKRGNNKYKSKAGST